MTSIFSCLCSGGFEKDRSIRRDWSFPHSAPLDPDLSDVEEDEYYTYPQKSTTNTIALEGSTTKVVYTNDDDNGDGSNSGYISDEGIYYGNGENNSVNDSVTVDGGYEYDDGGYGIGGDDGYASSDEGEEDGGDDNYSGDGGNNFRGGDYESA